MANLEILIWYIGSSFFFPINSLETWSMDTVSYLIFLFDKCSQIPVSDAVTFLKGTFIYFASLNILCFAMKVH